MSEELQQRLEARQADIEARLGEISHHLTGLCLHADGEILPTVEVLHVERDGLEAELAAIRLRLAELAEAAPSSPSPPAGRGFVPFLLRVPRPPVANLPALNPTRDL